MPQIYYKVVTKNLQSACVCFYEDYPHWKPYHVDIQYEINKWATSFNGTPLYVFNSKQKAERFVQKNDLLQNKTYIYSCHIKTKRSPMLLESMSQFPYLIKRIKNKQRISSFMKRTYKMFIPKGTIAVSKVKLLERIN